MNRVKCSDILKAVDGILVCGDPETEISGISIDSRKISQGDLFIPIAGERFDGHDFIAPSLLSGAAASLTHKDVPPQENKVIIRVDNTQKALADIARWYRSLFGIPVVAVTGSVGKTSTKDMVASVLAQKFKVLKTQGNFNNEIGLPLTLFNLEKGHSAAVIEMGMSNAGEISRLARIAAPHIAIITNIGVSHIENLGSKENIYRAKMEVLDGMDKNGILILNADDDMLQKADEMTDLKKVYYGIENKADFSADDIRKDGEKGTYFKVKASGKDYSVHIPSPGLHNVYNALAAFAAGMELEIPAEEIIKGISEFSSGKMRLNIFEHKGIKIIDDAYNASPQSMEAALNVLMDISSGRRTIAVMGDMLELGEISSDAHYSVGAFAASKGVDFIAAVGSRSSFIEKGALDSGCRQESIRIFKTNEEVNLFLGNFVKSGDVLLIKGSRGMKMEQITEYIRKL